MTDRGKDFADLAYTVIVQEKRFATKSVAAEMGMSYDAFYARIVNRTPFTAEEIRRLIRVAPDRRFATWLLRGTPFVAAERADADQEVAADIEAIHLAATRIVVEAVDVLTVVEDGLRDQRIDHRDAPEIRGEIESAECALASLSARLHEMTPGMNEETT